MAGAGISWGMGTSDEAVGSAGAGVGVVAEEMDGLNPVGLQRDRTRHAGLIRRAESDRSTGGQVDTSWATPLWAI